MQKAPLNAPRSAANLQHYQPVDEHLYPDNMNIIAVVLENEERLQNVEVAAFVGDECRGAVTCRGGYYFLTIMGDSNGDIDKTVELRVFDGTEEYVVGKLVFISDAFVGTLEEPYEINLSATGISEMANDGSHMSDIEWYTLSGVKLAGKPTRDGVYMVCPSHSGAAHWKNGHKVIVKGNNQQNKQLK